MIVPDHLKKLRAEQPEEIRRFVGETMFDIEARLLAALPQMSEAVLTSGKQASYTPTVTFRQGKNSTLKVSVAARVRLPDEEKQFVFRVGAAGQLELYREPDLTMAEEPKASKATAAARKAEMDAEAMDGLDDEPAFTPTRELDEEDVPLPLAEPVKAIAPAPRANGPMTPAQQRMAAIREQNLKLAREGKLSPAQMEAAKITPEDLEQQRELEEVANA